MIIERVKLIEALTKIMPGIDRKELVQEMSQFHFTGKNIVAYNDAVHVRLPFSTNFQCSVHAQTLYNLLKGLSTDKVKLELDGTSLKFNTLGITANLVTGEGQTINEILDSIDKEIKHLERADPLPSDFLKAIELCAFSAFVKDIGGSFTCIKVSGKHVMSSDKTRLSCYEMVSTMPEIMFKANIALDMVKYNLKFVGESKAWLHFFEARDGLVFSVRKYTGDYPVNEILAMIGVVKASSKITLPEEVLASLGFLNIFTEGQEQKHVQITAKEGTLIFQVKGTKGTVTKKMKVETVKNFSFGINPIFLGEILKRGMRTIEVCNMDKGSTAMAYFRSKNFTHAIALFE